MKNRFRFLVSFLILFAFSNAFSQENSTAVPLEAPYFKNTSNNKTTEQLPLKSTDVKIKIVGIIADVETYQTYVNTGTTTIEAIYCFPLSENSAVNEMEMKIGNRIIKAQIKEKNAARKLYEEAKSQGNKASLLEQERPNVFSMNVANIRSGDTVKIKIRHNEILYPDEGVYSFHYPTVVGPRYHNGSNDKSSSNKFVSSPYSHSGILPKTKFNLSLELISSVPVGQFKCLTHKVFEKHSENNNYSVVLSTDEIYSANRDFIINYTLKSSNIENGIQFYDNGDEKFFLAMVQAPKFISNEDIPPREYIFVVDVSGSMYGFPLDISKKLIRNLLSNLKPTDKFNIILFAASSSVLSENSLYANEINILKAIDLINRQQGGGGTEILNALQRTLKIPKDSESLSRSVVIITDGYVTVEKEAMSLIKNNLNIQNVFAFGIGSSVNRFLISGMARAGNGLPFIAINQSDADIQAEKFRKYIQSPVLSNIKTKFNNFKAYDLINDKIPDLMSDRPILLMGKYSGEPKGSIEITGFSGTKKHKINIDLNQGKISNNYSSLRSLWAREKVKTIGESGDYAGDQEIKQITDLGLKYKLMTEYTSFVAVEKVENNVNDNNYESVKQELPMPLGVPDSAIGADFEFSEVFTSSNTISNLLIIISLIGIVTMMLIIMKKIF